MHPMALEISLHAILFHKIFISYGCLLKHVGPTQLSGLFSILNSPSAIAYILLVY